MLKSCLILALLAAVLAHSALAQTRPPPMAGSQPTPSETQNLKPPSDFDMAVSADQVLQEELRVATERNKQLVAQLISVLAQVRATSGQAREASAAQRTIAEWQKVAESYANEIVRLRKSGEHSP